MPFPPHLRKPAAVGLAIALAALALVLAFRGWDHWVEDRLARWAVDQVAGRTRGAYRLTLGDLGFLPLQGSISFDSARVTTDSARNRRRDTPLPALKFLGRGCRVSGLDVPMLLLRKTFSAASLGCRRVVVRLALTTPEGGDRRSPSGRSDSTAPEGDLARSLGLRSFRVGEVSLPALDATVTRPGADGGSSITLQEARLDARDIAYDPSATLGVDPTLEAGGARLLARGLVLRPDTLSRIVAVGVHAGFSDSTLSFSGARHEPPIPESEWVRKLQVRRDRITFELDSLAASGVAWRRFLASGDIGMRRLELHGARLDVLTDRRIPKGRPRRHRTPQQIAAASGPALRLDTVIVAGGTFAYRERRPGAERPGRVSFDSVRATARNLHLPSRGEPLRIEARAKVMNQGPLAVALTVPLDAPDFRYELTARLGPMPAAAFNRFLSPNEAFRFDEGQVDGVEVRQSVRGGLARSTVTPRYRDLSVEPTGDGGGILGSVKRGVTKFVANAFVVRSHNPDDDGDDLRVARTTRPYDPTQTWIQFLWVSMRDGLMEGLKERPDRSP